MSWLKRLFGRSRPPGADEFMALAEEAREHLGALTLAHQMGWRLGEHQTWELDYETGALRFTFDDGTVVACSAQAVGSLDAQSGSWMWAWANESLARFPGLLTAAQAVRSHGEEHGLIPLSAPGGPADTDMAWELTAVAVKLTDAAGAFCGVNGPLHMFLAFKDVKLDRFHGVDEALGAAGPGEGPPAA